MRRSPPAAPERGLPGAQNEAAAAEIILEIGYGSRRLAENALNKS